MILIFCLSHVCKWGEQNIKTTFKYNALQYNNTIHYNLCVQVVGGAGAVPSDKRCSCEAVSHGFRSNVLNLTKFQNLLDKSFANLIFVCTVYNWWSNIIVSSTESIILFPFQKKVFIESRGQFLLSC